MPSARRSSTAPNIALIARSTAVRASSRVVPSSAALEIVCSSRSHRFASTASARAASSGGETKDVWLVWDEDRVVQERSGSNPSVALRTWYPNG